MLSSYLLCIFCLQLSTSVLALPQHAQAPLLPNASTSEQPLNDVPRPRSVVMVFRRNGEGRESTINVTLGQTLKGTLLHGNPLSGADEHISSMAIVSALDLDSGEAGSVEDLARIRCRITPVFSLEEKQASGATGRQLHVWPTFGAQDGNVILDRSESRWFLAGRRIESVECW